MSAIAPKPEGTGLSGRSALSRLSPVGPATGVASLRASHPGKPPSRPRGACSEVPYRSHLLGACVGRSIFGLQVNPQGENTMRFLVSKGGWRRAAGIAMGGALAWAAPALAQKAELLVYTALETDQIKAYEEAFYKAVPDVTIKWVRDSTGVITAKVLAEKANPQADLVVGTSASSMAVFANEGLLQGYAPKGVEKLSPQYVDPSKPPQWVGMDVYGAAVCFNTVEAGKQGLPKPESWKDLTKPGYKGKIVMPNPASSGTGFLDVAGWLQMWGEADGWKFMDALHENIALYTHSGSQPCARAGQGEFPIGISFEYRAMKTKKVGAPVVIVFPRDGLGWGIGDSGIL